MFAQKHLRRIISHMARDQRHAIQAGVIALLLLPLLFINAFM